MKGKARTLKLAENGIQIKRKEQIRVAPMQSPWQLYFKKFFNALGKQDCNFNFLLDLESALAKLRAFQKYEWKQAKFSEENSLLLFKSQFDVS